MSTNDEIKEATPCDQRHVLVIVPAHRQEEAIPDATWPLDDLLRYGLCHINEAALLARRSAITTFRAGRAFSFAKPKFKENQEWVQWQQRNELARTTVWEAIQLVEKAKTEEAISGLSITEAKRKFGIGCKRQRPDTRDGRRNRRATNPTTQPRQEATPSVATATSDNLARDLDAVARNMGEEYRQAILSGEARLSPQEIRTLAGGGPPGANPHVSVVVNLSSQQLPRQLETAPAGLLGNQTLTGAGDAGPAVEAAGEEESVDEELLEQVTDLVRRMNHPTRLAFVSQPLVLAAVRRLPPALVAAA